MYSAQGEFEGTLNSIGQRQNDMIKKLPLTMEWSILNKSGEGSKSRQPQVQIPEFSHSIAGYKLDPVNLPSSHRHDRKKEIAHSTVPSPHPLCTQRPIIKIVNKIKNSLKILCSFVFLIDCCCFCLIFFVS